MLLNEEEYQEKMVPCIIKLFSSNDRETRAKMLQELHQFVPYLSSSVVNDHIFPNIANGFIDSNAYIREMTIKVCFFLSLFSFSQRLGVDIFFFSINVYDSRKLSDMTH